MSISVPLKKWGLPLKALRILRAFICNQLLATYPALC